VSHLKRIPQISYRQRRSDPVGQLFHEQFNQTYFPDIFEISDIVVDHAGQPLTLPPPPGSFFRSKKWLGKSSELQQLLHIAAVGFFADFMG